MNILDFFNVNNFLNKYFGFRFPTLKKVVAKCLKLIWNQSGIISRTYFSPFQGVFYLYRGLRRAPNRLGICQKIYTTQFSGKRILHTENAYIETIFANNKQQKYIIISNLALFWLILNKMCRFFNSYEESLCVYVYECV